MIEYLDRPAPKSLAMRAIYTILFNSPYKVFKIFKHNTESSIRRKIMANPLDLNSYVITYRSSDGIDACKASLENALAIFDLNKGQSAEDSLDEEDFDFPALKKIYEAIEKQSFDEDLPEIEKIRMVLDFVNDWLIDQDNDWLVDGDGMKYWLTEIVDKF